MQQWPSDTHFVSNIAMEKLVNAFFRLSSAEIIDNLKGKFTELSDQPSEETVFLKLRELRNHW